LVVIAPWLIRVGLVFGDPLQGVRDSMSVETTWGEFPWTWYFTRLPLTAGWPVVVAAAIGVVVAVRDRHTAAITALIAAAAVFGAHSAFVHKEDRYISAALPFVAALGGVGLVRGVAPLVARRAGARAGSVTAWTLALLAAFTTMLEAKPQLILI